MEVSFQVLSTDAGNCMLVIVNNGIEERHNTDNVVIGASKPPAERKLTKMS